MVHNGPNGMEDRGEEAEGPLHFGYEGRGAGGLVHPDVLGSWSGAGELDDDDVDEYVGEDGCGDEDDVHETGYIFFVGQSEELRDK